MWLCWIFLTNLFSGFLIYLNFFDGFYLRSGRMLKNLIFFLCFSLSVFGKIYLFASLNSESCVPE